MTSGAVRTIHPSASLNAHVQVPPSKSYTNRALIAAALADGTSHILEPSQSEDSEHLIRALQQFGVAVSRSDGKLEIVGSGGILKAPAKEIDVGNAGTAMRFLATFAAIAQGETVLTGDEQMMKRPMKDLLDALRSAGIKSWSRDGYPPVTIHGGNFLGGQIHIDARISSQFVSSILLTAPYSKRPVSLHVKGKLSSMPYVDMSLHVMRAFGAEVNAIDMKNFQVSNQQKYIGNDFLVEADASAATYFLAAAAVTGGSVVITNFSAESLQGDARFLTLLSDMGCTVIKHDDSVEVKGGRLLGIDVDMNQIPDCVPTLAVVAAFAEGPTSISNIEHLKFKETNRLRALAVELSKLGARVDVHDDGITIHPQPLRACTIETYNDHRIAMSFAIAGLRQEGIVITNPSCVAKSFPGFWDEFNKIESQA